VTWCEFCGKQEYATRAAAWAAIRFLRAMGGKQRGVYKCVRAFHTTSRRPRRRHTWRRETTWD
jgi:hypothetical protein